MRETSIWTFFRDGQSYIKEWPLRKELMTILPENRIIKATQFAIKVMPAVAVISVLTQMAFNNYDGLPLAIIVALFALSLPLQGLFWLGKRRQTQLPPALAGWYRELHQKVVVEVEQDASSPLNARPRYQELAHILTRAFKQLDQGALERWF